MSFVITKQINGRFNYWWNKDSKRWEGLKNNASVFTTSNQVNEAIGTIRILNLLDKSVESKIYRSY